MNKKVERWPYLMNDYKLKGIRRKIWTLLGLNMNKSFTAYKIAHELDRAEQLTRIKNYCEDLWKKGLIEKSESKRTHVYAFPFTNITHEYFWRYFVRNADVDVIADIQERLMKKPKIERKCDICNKSFKPMTDEQWEIVKYEHETISNKHKDYLKLKKSS